MKTNLKLNKIPITSLMEILTHLFEEGANYVDIEKEINNEEENDEEENNFIRITVKPDYYKEENENEDDEDDEEKKEKYTEFLLNRQEKEINQLSDDDINNLI